MQSCMLKIEETIMKQVYKVLKFNFEAIKTTYENYKNSSEISFRQNLFIGEFFRILEEQRISIHYVLIWNT